MIDSRTYAERKRYIRMRKSLIDLLQDCHFEPEEAEALADYLVENGVTAKIKKTPTDLLGKCGSCVYANAEPDDFGRECYVRCRNADHITKHSRGKDISLRQRTTPACKDYKQREGAENGRDQL